MSRLTELEKWSDHEEWIWPCDCHHPGHYLRASWDVADPEWRYIWIEQGMHPPMLRDRLRDAWRCLIGRPCTGGEVVLSNEVIEDLKRFMALRSD
jgi:hypothetical protein